MNKNIIIIFSIIVAFVLGFMITNGRVIKMNSNKTVQEAIDNIDSHKKDAIDKVLSEQVIKEENQEEASDFEIYNITIIALKEEKILEVWSKNKEGKNIKINDYKITAASGNMGPKLKEGDKQVPEGLYTIEYLNPNSSYHLSMKINYPNSFDKKMAAQSNRTNLGGDIFIHGKSVSIGCIAIGDEAIEELFYMVSKVGINKVTIIVAPLDLRVKDIDISKVDLPWYDELVQSIKTEIIKYK